MVSSEPERVDFSSGDDTIAAYRWDPDGEPRAILQITHGMGEHALRYADLAQALNRQGYVVYAQDHRGHGNTARSPEQLGVIGAAGWTELVRDIGRLSALATAAHPGLPLVLLGHSMGSFALQQHLLDQSGAMDAVALTGTAAIDLLEPALDLEQPLDLTAFNAAFEPARTEYDWLSRDDSQVDAYVADQYCGFGLDPDGARQMFLSARPLADDSRLAALRKDLPVWIGVGEADPVNGELALVRALVDRLTSAGLTDVTLVTYPDARHEVFNETNKDQVVSDLLAWLEIRVSGRRIVEADDSAGQGRPRV